MTEIWLQFLLALEFIIISVAKRSWPETSQCFCRITTHMYYLWRSCSSGSLVIKISYVRYKLTTDKCFMSEEFRIGKCISHLSCSLLVVLKHFILNILLILGVLFCFSHVNFPHLWHIAEFFFLEIDSIHKLKQFHWGDFPWHCDRPPWQKYWNPIN